ncbi:two-component system response regulator [uncultured Thiodictyon sp.]|uniref:HD-GYP domain-containing protein n=1 Tax=uncultured Thiodictyon sp. TaxID=1846217 RepID=UPI0025D91B0A|nr:two-component system response regulator [uncultured Thiodictyon sp.]
MSEQSDPSFPSYPSSNGDPSAPATILIVDDLPDNLAVLGDILLPQYRVLAASTGERALRLAAAQPPPDLILLDVMMPGMDGYQVLARLQADEHTRDIPVIFVTAMNGVEDEERGLEQGAADYIAKPLRPRIVLARVHTQLALKRAGDLLRERNASLEAEVQRRLGENQVIQDVSIHALARLAEVRDNETGNHLRRTQGYVSTLARRLREQPRFAGELTERTLDLLAKSALLHDIGKVGIPDHILRKPGPLTAAEREVMKTHAKLGSDAIEQAERDALRPVAFLTLAKDIAHYHHEQWDGSGYPEGLVGEAIPLAARLMALADVFDALISRRVYKEPFPLETARDLIREASGRQFDPTLVEVFLDGFDEIAAIANRYRDG